MSDRTEEDIRVNINNYESIIEEIENIKNGFDFSDCTDDTYHVAICKRFYGLGISSQQEKIEEQLCQTLHYQQKCLSMINELSKKNKQIESMRCCGNCKHHSENTCPMNPCCDDGVECTWIQRS
ncbi:MAG: hypothetical protein JRJ00_00105 [Deltaproteobacteria bacterium]|nr:hypothetical protein [Deltaproteobacteria bacterium]